MRKKIVTGFTLFILLIGLSACNDTTVDDNVEVIDELIVVEGEVSTATIEDVDFDDVYEDYLSRNYTTLESSLDEYLITDGGVYVLTGTYDETIVIDCGDEDVDLVLLNVTISSTDGPAISVISADDIIISAPGNTINYLSDSSVYSDETLSAVIYSVADVTINGSGTIIIDANYNNGIQTKDDLVIIDTTLTITSVDDGIVARDSLAVQNGMITIKSSGDAITTTNTEDAEKGFIYIASGTFNLNAGSDAIDAVNSIIIESGTFDIVSDLNGIETDGTLVINNGTFDINSGNDGIHSSSNITIMNGEITILAYDDGIHADEIVIINDGTISIEDSYEGIEGKQVYVNGGDIDINASDDGINVSSGGSLSYQLPGQIVTNTTVTSETALLQINGGTIVVNSSGDGLDANGVIQMTGGYVIVYGPTTDMEGPIDYDQSFYISGGVIIAVGSRGMAQAPSTGSDQNSLLYAGITYSAGTEIVLYDSEGNEIISLTPNQNFASVVISSSDLVLGESYTLVVGSTTNEFTISSDVTTIGSVSNTMDPNTRPPGK